MVRSGSTTHTKYTNCPLIRNSESGQPNPVTHEEGADKREMNSMLWPSASSATQPHGYCEVAQDMTMLLNTANWYVSNPNEDSPKCSLL